MKHCPGIRPIGHKRAGDCFEPRSIGLLPLASPTTMQRSTLPFRFSSVADGWLERKRAVGPRTSASFAHHRLLRVDSGLSSISKADVRQSID
jgi:hypothetical protein